MRVESPPFVVHRAEFSPLQEAFSETVRSAGIAQIPLAFFPAVQARVAILPRPALLQHPVARVTAIENRYYGAIPTHCVCGDRTSTTRKVLI